MENIKSFLESKLNKYGVNNSNIYYLVKLNNDESVKGKIYYSVWDKHMLSSMKSQSNYISTLTTGDKESLTKIAGEANKTGKLNIQNMQ